MAEVVQLERKGYRLDDALKPVNALCARWAGQAWDWAGGDVNLIWKAMREREGAAYLGGPEDMSEEVLALDTILAKSEPRYQAVIVHWYIRGGSVAQKAVRLGTNRTDLYALWRRTLEYLRGRLHEKGVNV